MSTISEKTIENGLVKYLKEYPFCTVYRQVELYRKRIDIIVKSEYYNEVWGIEVKIKDWKAALRQAVVNSIACAHTYVAIWHKHKNAAIKNKNKFEMLGVGLMVIDQDYKPKIEFNATKNDINYNAYEKIKQVLCQN
jgi:hypothetical protein